MFNTRVCLHWGAREAVAGVCQVVVCCRSVCRRKLVTFNIMQECWCMQAQLML